MKLADLKDHALGTLEGWIDGWTDPDEDGHQYRLRLAGHNHEEGTLDVKVEAGRFDAPPDHDMYYRVTLTVEAIRRNQ